MKKTNVLLAGLILLLIALAATGTVILSGNIQTRDAMLRYQTGQLPSEKAVDELVLMVTRSKMLSVTWVYMAGNQEDKAALRRLHFVEYPAIRSRIDSLMINWSPDDQRQMEAVFSKFDTLILFQQTGFMTHLQTFENYEDPLTRLLAEDAIESEIMPLTKTLLSDLQAMAARHKEASAQAGIASVTETKDVFRKSSWLTGASAIICLCIVIYVIVAVRTSRRSLQDVQSLDSAADLAAKKVQLIEWIATSKNDDLIRKLEAMKK
jgi:hypothetical protein